MEWRTCPRPILEGFLVQLNAIIGTYKQGTKYDWTWQQRPVCMPSMKSSLWEKSVLQRWDLICSSSRTELWQTNTEHGKLLRKHLKELLSQQSMCSNMAMVETLGRQKGVSLVPLLYVVHEDAIGDYELLYQSTEKQLMACLAHAGENYNTDREAVYSSKEKRKSHPLSKGMHQLEMGEWCGEQC